MRSSGLLSTQSTVKVVENNFQPNTRNLQQLKRQKAKQIEGLFWNELELIAIFTNHHWICSANQFSYVHVERFLMEFRSEPQLILSIRATPKKFGSGSN